MLLRLDRRLALVVLLIVLFTLAFIVANAIVAAHAGVLVHHPMADGNVWSRH